MWANIIAQINYKASILKLSTHDYNEMGSCKPIHKDTPYTKYADDLTMVCKNKYNLYKMK